jgi:alkaline phosphatase D
MPRQLLRNAYSRRRFMTGAGAGLALVAAPALIRNAGAQVGRAGNPFSLVVASGTPRPDGFVLWTRLAPDPLSANPETPGGMTGGDVALRFEIATDDAMKNIVRHGTAAAEQKYAYSVHLDVAGLEPGRPYWYRFLSGDAASTVGRAMTLPAPGASPAAMRFGYVSCSNYEHS